jgi:hypothetical protein
MLNPRLLAWGEESTQGQCLVKALQSFGSAWKNDQVPMTWGLASRKSFAKDK